MQEADNSIAAKIKTKRCTKNKDGIYIENGINRSHAVILIPEKLSLELASFLHCYHGHPGAENLETILKRHFHIYDIRGVCSKVTQRCEDCIITKPQPHLKNDTKPTADFALEPSRRYYTDLADFGRKDENGNRYFLGIMDELSRYVDGVPLPDKENETVARGLANLLLRHNATHGKCVLDNGREFNGPITRKLYELFQISISHVSPYYPRGNKIERVWREMGIKARLSKLDINTWSRDIYVMLYHINNTPHKALQHKGQKWSPAEVLTGRSPQCPVFPEPADNDADVDEYTWVSYLSRWLYQIGTDLAKKNKLRMENQNQPKLKAKRLEVGTRICFWSPQPKGVSKKLYRSFANEATITRIIPGGHSYEVTDPHGRKYIRNARFLRVLPAKQLLEQD